MHSTIALPARLPEYSSNAYLGYKMGKAAADKSASTLDM